MTIPASTLDRLAALRRGELAGVRELRLPGLDAVPSEIFGLSDTLEILDLSGGTITELPDDLGRLHRLRVLFCSGNRFARLPPVLGDCSALSQIGFRGCGLRDVPSEALPPALRWLTLTDNRIETLPDTIGERPLLQKLMLSGNSLHRLPDSLAAAPNLELLRLAANRFETLPPWLVALPRLAWISWAGNPFDAGTMPDTATRVPWSDLDIGERLGEGASGHVHRALWQRPGTASARPVALKLFKGGMTSDGLPEREMAACLTAGSHPNLTGALGQVTHHPEGAQGLVMPLVPEGWHVLAGPPSLESCSRDVYDPELSFDPETALHVATGIAAATAHIHARGLLHGDLYAHNILWDGDAGEAVLSDFGAASMLPADGSDTGLKRLDIRAWGLFLGELLCRCTTKPAGLRDLEQACIQPDASARPLMADIVGTLARIRPNTA